MTLPWIRPAQFETLVSDCQPAAFHLDVFLKTQFWVSHWVVFSHSIFVPLNRGAAHSCKSSIWESCLVFLLTTHIQLITNSCKLLRPSFSSFFSWVEFFAVNCYYLSASVQLSFSCFQVILTLRSMDPWMFTDGLQKPVDSFGIK